jgi:hypothetical protein
MTPDTVPHDPNDAYELVRNLVFHQVHKFRRRYGGEFDELVCEANLAFVKGHAQFTTGKTATGKTITDPYATEIRRWVWYEMFDAMRTRLRRKAIAPMVAIKEGQEFPDRLPEWDVSSWAAELGPDARLAVELVLNPPAPIENTAEAKGGEPRNYRSTVRAHLAADLGWSTKRINAAFEEIRRALG